MIPLIRKDSVFAAFKYFASIKDIEGINYSLARIGSKNRSKVFKEVAAFYQEMTIL
ncbi:MAG: hypothetical protein J7501_00515 [Bdellovibrio sp.]|nr:hypothetical protein [Bdellovibrio sp.]